MERSIFDKMQDFGLALGGNHQQLGRVREQRMLGDEMRKKEALAKQQRTGELSEGRKKAAAMDFREIGMALDAGLPQEAKRRIEERLKFGSLFKDFDPTSSNHIKTLLDEGRMDEAKDFLNFADQAAVARGYIDAKPAREGYTLAEGASRYGPDGNLIASNPRAVEQKAAVPPVPVEMLKGLPEEVAARAAAAYNTAGGGNTGLTAMNGVIAGEERARVANAEAQEAQGTRDKARGVQLTAIGLASSILANPDTGDVIGSMQGRGLNNMFDSGNTQAVADIEELANILTAGNLDLMSGVLSESDMKVIASVAGGGLDRRRDDKSFVRRVERILFSLANAQEFTEEELSQLSTEELKKYSNVLAAGQKNER